MASRSTCVLRRLLVVGFYPRLGGLARDAFSILRAFEGAWDRHVLAVRYSGLRHERDGIVVHPSQRDLSYGASSLAGSVRELRPEVVVLVNDLPWIRTYLQALHGVEPRPRVIALTPIDGELGPESLNGLDALDLLVVPTQWAAAMLRAAPRPLPPLAVIPHDVCGEVFFPLPGDDAQRRRRARLELWPERLELADSFIVFNGNTDTPRKRLDTTVWAFGEFAKARPDAYLYLHHLNADSPLRGLAQRLGISDRLLPRPVPMERACTDAQLNLLYNACDVGLNTSLGEGWGLVSVEHALTGAAQIVPRHSALTEIWHGAAECVEPAGSIRGSYGVRWQTTASSSYVPPLMRLHDDPDHRRSVAAACAARAGQSAWSPAAVGRRWRELIETPPSRGRWWESPRNANQVNERGRP